MKPLQPILFRYAVLSGVFAVLGGVLFFACTSSESPSSESPPISFCFFERNACISHGSWLGASEGDIDNSFHNPAGDGSKRALTYKIDRQQVNELLRISQPFEDAAMLRIYMALASDENGAAGNSSPSFQPFLHLVNTQEKAIQDTVVFKMDYTRINVIPYLKSLLAEDHGIIPEDSIGIEIALEMITAWDTLPQATISEVMYNNTTTKAMTPVRFYTFDKEDTRRILAALVQNKQDLLYLNLGVYEEEDAIPFRTIVQVNDPANFPYEDLVQRPPALFEFAAPCPKVCADQ